MIWPVLIEKAYAKMKGSYSVVDSKHATTALRAITGAPVFTYVFAGSNMNTDNVYNLLSEASHKKWVASLSTYQANVDNPNVKLNGCGLPVGQAYSSLATF